MSFCFFLLFKNVPAEALQPEGRLLCGKALLRRDLLLAQHLFGRFFVILQHAFLPLRVVIGVPIISYREKFVKTYPKKRRLFIPPSQFGSK